LLPYFNITPETVLPYLSEAIPPNVFSFLKPAITSLLESSSGGMLSISVLAALWSSSRGINALQTALNRAYGVEDRGNFVISRIVSVGIVGVLMMAIIAVALFFSAGQVILDALQQLLRFSPDIINTFLALRWPVTLIGLLVILGGLYIVIPNAHVRIKYALPGTVFATVGWIVLAQGFSIYARTFAQRVSGYQIIGSFIVLMFWLNFAATIIILGGVLNVTIEEYRTGQEVKEGSNRLNKWLNKLKDRFIKKKK
jgi:membrane protein